MVVAPLFGEPLAATAAGAPIVSLGASAGERATIARSALMGRTLLTHGNRSTPAGIKRRAYERMLAHLRTGELQVRYEEVALERFADAWRWQGESPHRKLVLVSERRPPPPGGEEQGWRRSPFVGARPRPRQGAR